MPPMVTSAHTAAMRAAPRPKPPLNENQEGLAAFMQQMGRHPPSRTRAIAMRAAPLAAAAITPDPQIAKANFQQWLAESENEP